MFGQTGSRIGTKSRFIVVLVLIVSACGGASDPGGPPATGVGSTPLPGGSDPIGSAAAEELSALLPVFEGTADERLAEGQRLIRLQLVEELGLADALTPDVFAAGDILLRQAFEDEFPDLAPEAAGEPGSPGTAVLLAAKPIGARLQEAPMMSGLWTAPSWASSALSGLWHDATSPGEVSSEPHTNEGTKQDKGGITTKIKSSHSRKGRQFVAEVTYTVTYTVDGKAYTEVTHVNVKSDACPDVDGVLNITYDMDYSLTGGKTATRNASGTATAHVGNDAYMQSLDHSTEHVNDSGPIRLGYSTPVATTESQVRDRDNVSFGDKDFTSASGLDGKSDVDKFEAVSMAFWITGSFVEKVAEHAQSAWRNGGCVTIVVPEGTDHKVKAKESFTFTARVDHKFEGGNVPVPVNAELSGDGTLVPGRIDPAPDTFVMTDGEGDHNSVYLETVSRRGRDTETVHFAIRGGWEASSEGGRISITGTVSDITEPFTLEGVFEGGEASLTFVPTDEHGGSYTYTGGGSGVTVSGGGTYTLEGNEGEVLTLRYSGDGCANPGGCAKTSAVVILTPQD